MSNDLPTPHPLRIGLKLSGQDTTIEELRGVWRIADEAGFDHVWDMDHLASIGGGGTDRPIFEGWALQAAMAQATKRVRVGCMVSGNTYRHPVVLAKLATTVDHLSGGRLEFGIGAAWATAEHEMYGIEGLDHRVGRLSESLRIITSLWTRERTTFTGRYYRLSDAIGNPKPVQRPHPPIWIGAGGESTLKLTARYADVWNVSDGGVGPHSEEMSRRLDDLCVAIGRDPAAIRRSVQFSWDGASREQLLDLAGRALRGGFTEQIVMLPAGRAVEVGEKVANALADCRALQRAGPAPR